MLDNIVEIQGLSKKIRGKFIIDNISFNIKNNEILGLVGNNGSGKTTIMKLICGLYKQSSGDIKIQGKSFYENRKYLIENIGAIIENPALYETMTGYKNLKIFSRMHKNINENRINEVIKILEMDFFIDKKVKEYSLGMKQRLGIAIAILHKPKLLILDEPINGLDPKGIVTLRNYLRILSKEHNTTILISTHITSEIENLCDRVLIINNGTIQEEINLNGENKTSIEEKLL